MVGGRGHRWYMWGQTSQEVVVVVKVPLETKGKDIRCSIQPRTLDLHVATLPLPKRIKEKRKAEVRA